MQKKLKLFLIHKLRTLHQKNTTNNQIFENMPENAIRQKIQLQNTTIFLKE